MYFGLALVLGIRFTVFQAGVIALSLLYSAFFAEIFRSALQAVPPGHTEAGLALGMRPSQIFFSVTLPQAVKIALPNIGSMFIGMVKDTSTFTACTSKSAQLQPSYAPSSQTPTFRISAAVSPNGE